MHVAITDVVRSFDFKLALCLYSLGDLSYLNQKVNVVKKKLKKLSTLCGIYKNPVIDTEITAVPF